PRDRVRVAVGADAPGLHLCVLRRLPPAPPLFPYTTLFRSHAARDRVIDLFTGRHPDPRDNTFARQDFLFHVRQRLRRITALVLRSEEHTSELQSRENLVCRLLLEKKNLEADRQLATADVGV